MRPIPTKDDILAWIRENPRASGKREIARAFGLKGADRVELKRLLRELQDDGEIERRKRQIRPAGALPPVTIVKVSGLNDEGELLARPADWDGDDAPPVILVIPRRSDPAFGPGDRILCKITPVRGEDHGYQARPIKKIAASSERILGIFRAGHEGGRLVPVDKRASREWTIRAGDTGDAKDGELVEAEAMGGARMGLPRGRIVLRHGDPGAPRQVSMIAMAQHQIAYEFPENVLKEAGAAKPVTSVGKREDLRDLPLITIDPSDARDHDDAICAAPDDDPANAGGHVVWVAIADVAHYVRAGSALDHEARKRGNSTYFPDRVSPMLPDSLSGDLCSLHEGLERPCLAVRMVLDANGRKRSHRFARGLMRSPASLSYEAVQAAVDGDDGLPEALTDDVLHPLYAAYRAAMRARADRQPLDLDMPERRIVLDEEGSVSSIAYRDRLDAHRLVEEFMILANVCAAETLEQHRTPLLYRVHEEPSAEKLDALRKTIETLGLTLAKGQVLKTRHFNDILRSVRGSEVAETVLMSVLRTQTQAYYAPQNLGHFGLNLIRYAHFTSPIRRYADLIVHRALIKALKLGPDGLDRNDTEQLAETAELISKTERRSMEAERDTIDRYLAAYLADREGSEFEGRVAGVSRAGVFVKLDETGADGLIPISTLGSDYFRHDRDANTLTGERSGRVIGLGMRATVRLREATPVTGGLILEMLSVDGTAMSDRRQARGRMGPRRKLSKATKTRAKTARKAKKQR